MREPAFWDRDGIAARLLAPLGRLYDAAGRRRGRGVTAFDAGVPVICVGNATSGGTGKTPLAIDLTRRLQRRGRLVHLLTRGYKGREAGPLQVLPFSGHDPRRVGDEALLLSRAAPVWVARDRAAGARAAVAEGAQALVLDDGLQHPGLKKDLSLLVVDGTRGFGNARPIPAGPLRESLDRALARADAAVVTGDDRAGVARRLEGRLPVLHAHPQVDQVTRNRLAGRRALAFCGIGRPAKFFDMLARLGVEVVETRAFADHHLFRPSEVTGMLEMAKRGSLTPVTTEKDAVRLPPWAQARVEVVPITVAWDDESMLEGLLDRVLAGPGAREVPA